MIQQEGVSWDDEVVPVADSEDRLERLGRLVNRMGELDASIGEATETLKKLEAEYRRLAQVDVPAILDETGVSELKLKDGRKVYVDERWCPPSMGARSEFRPKMVAWLEDQGLDDVVKDTVTAQFGKGEGAQAEVLLTFIERELGRDDIASRLRTVHAQTLAALVKELVAEGRDIPMDELGITKIRTAKVK